MERKSPERSAPDNDGFVRQQRSVRVFTQVKQKILVTKLMDDMGVASLQCYNLYLEGQILAIKYAGIMGKRAGKEEILSDLRALLDTLLSVVAKINRDSSSASQPGGKPTEPLYIA